MSTFGRDILYVTAKRYGLKSLTTHYKISGNEVNDFSILKVGLQNIKSILKWNLDKHKKGKFIE